MAMAILLTVSSNMLGILTVPLLLPLLLGSAAGGLQLDSWALLKQLVVMVLLPTVAGALARAFGPGAMGEFAELCTFALGEVDKMQEITVQEGNTERHTRQGFGHQVTLHVVASCRRGQGGGRQQAGADGVERHVLSSRPVDAGAARQALKRLLCSL